MEKQLKHDSDYDEAVQQRSYVWVSRDGEDVGDGTIVEFNDKTVTIIEVDGAICKFLRSKCQFFMETKPYMH